MRTSVLVVKLPVSFNADHMFRLFLGLTIGTTLLFGILSVLNREFVFFYDAIIIATLVYIVIRLHHKLQFSNIFIVSLLLVFLMHILGLNFYLHGIRLYDWWIIPQWFKYDNLVHLLSMFVITIILYTLANPHINYAGRNKKIVLAISMIMLALGIGVINEMLEFVVVIFFNGADLIGDYVNNAVDMFFNLIGAAIATYIIIIRKSL